MIVLTLLNWSRTHFNFELTLILMIDVNDATETSALLSSESERSCLELNRSLKVSTWVHEVQSAIPLMVRSLVLNATLSLYRQGDLSAALFWLSL